MYCICIKYSICRAYYVEMSLMYIILHMNTAVFPPIGDMVVKLRVTLTPGNIRST